MDEHTKTELYLSEEHLQQITGGTPEDASNWLHNLPDEHRSLFNDYKSGKGLSESMHQQALVLSRQYDSLRSLPAKTLSDGSIASRIGQLRPRRI